MFNYTRSKGWGKLCWWDMTVQPLKNSTTVHFESDETINKKVLEASWFRFLSTVIGFGLMLLNALIAWGKTQDITFIFKHVQMTYSAIKIWYGLCVEYLIFEYYSYIIVPIYKLPYSCLFQETLEVTLSVCYVFKIVSVKLKFWMLN